MEQVGLSVWSSDAFRAACQTVTELEHFLATNNADLCTPWAERELRLALDANDEETPPDVKRVLRREIGARYPSPSRYVDTGTPMFPVGRLPSHNWAYAGCFRVRNDDCQTMAVRHHSTLPTVLNDTIARNRQQMGLVRWSTRESILVVPRTAEGLLSTVGQVRLHDSECDVAGYTVREDNSRPSVELYVRVSHPQVETPDRAPTGDVLLPGEDDEEEQVTSAHATSVVTLTAPPAPRISRHHDDVRSPKMSLWSRLAFGALAVIAVLIIAAWVIRKSSAADDTQ